MEHSLTPDLKASPDAESNPPEGALVALAESEQKGQSSERPLPS